MGLVTWVGERSDLDVGAQVSCTCRGQRVGDSWADEVIHRDMGTLSDRL